jgi:inositol transport system substrate-binding protein
MALNTALRIIRKQPFDKETYIPFQLVTKENVARFLR